MPRSRSRTAVLAWGIIASAACGGDGTGSGPPPQLADAAALAARLDSLAAAFTTAPLQSLGAMALPLYLSDVIVNNFSPLTAGHVLEWNSGATRYDTTSRAGAPAGGYRVILYAIDSTTGLPAVPLVEVGAVDLHPRTFLLGGPIDSSSLRYVVLDTGAAPAVFADFTAGTHINLTCYCVDLTGFVAANGTHVDFTIPYIAAPLAATTFPGDFNGAPPAQLLRHIGTLPRAGDSVFGMNLYLGFTGDSVNAHGFVTLQSAGPPSGLMLVEVGGRSFAQWQLTPGSAAITGMNGAILTAADSNAVRALAALGFAMVFSVEWPVLTTFFCGC